MASADTISSVASVTKSLLMRIQSHGNLFRLDQRYPGFDADLQGLLQDFAQFEAQLTVVSETKSIIQL